MKYLLLGQGVPGFDSSLLNRHHIVDLDDALRTHTNSQGGWVSDEVATQVIDELRGGETKILLVRHRDPAKLGLAAADRVGPVIMISAYTERDQTGNNLRRDMAVSNDLYRKVLDIPQSQIKLLEEGQTLDDAIDPLDLITIAGPSHTKAEATDDRVPIDEAVKYWLSQPEVDNTKRRFVRAAPTVGKTWLAEHFPTLFDDYEKRVRTTPERATIWDAAHRYDPNQDPKMTLAFQRMLQHAIADAPTNDGRVIVTNYSSPEKLGLLPGNQIGAYMFVPYHTYVERTLRRDSKHGPVSEAVYERWLRTAQERDGAILADEDFVLASLPEVKQLIVNAHRKEEINDHVSR